MIVSRFYSLHTLQFLCPVKVVMVSLYTYNFQNKLVGCSRQITAWLQEVVEKKEIYTEVLLSHFQLKHSLFLRISDTSVKILEVKIVVVHKFQELNIWLPGQLQPRKSVKDCCLSNFSLNIIRKRNNVHVDVGLKSDYHLQTPLISSYAVIVDKKTPPAYLKPPVIRKKW